MGKNPEKTMTVLEHLAEFRWRLIISAVAFAVAAIFSFTRVNWIREVMTAPAGDIRLIYLTPPEALTANLRIAIIAGLVLASPVILYQIVAFIYPAFYRREKIFFLAVLAGILLLFGGGVVFAYRVTLPFALDFFFDFAAEELAPYLTISEYISFTSSFLLAFGLVFQLPLLTWILGRVGLISSRFLRRNRKFALLVILILAAVLTPPDVISQVILACPLLALYELGILMVVISEKKQAREGL